MTPYEKIVNDPAARAQLIAALLQGEDPSKPSNAVKIGGEVYGGAVALIVLSLRGLTLAMDKRLTELEAAPRKDA